MEFILINGLVHGLVAMATRVASRQIRRRAEARRPAVHALVPVAVAVAPPSRDSGVRPLARPPLLRQLLRGVEPALLPPPGAEGARGAPVGEDGAGGRGGTGATCRGAVGPEDFLPPAEADTLLPALLARSARGAEEDRQRHQRDEEIDTVLYEQGVASSLAFGDKVEEWRREATAQERIYVDLSSFDDDDD